MQNSIIGLILIMIMLHYVLGRGGKRQAHDSLFVNMIFSALVLLVLKMCMELLSGRVFLGSHTMYAILVSGLFVVSPLPGFFYFLYIDQLDKRWEKVPFHFGLLAGIPIAINFMFVLISLSNGMLFSLGANNIYTRGNYYFLFVACNIGYIVGGQIYLLFHRFVQGKKTNVPLFVVPHFLIIATIIQVNVEGMEIVLIAFTLSLLILFLHTQNTKANRDYLTSLYNRSVGEEYLNYLFSHTGKKDTIIGGMLMDINFFKDVNDQYGHEMGDRSLRSFAQLLRENFSRSWMICRYGGDEFLLLREMACAEGMDEALLKFKEGLEAFNALDIFPFMLEVSVGKGVVQDGHTHDPATFLKMLDENMYLNKRNYYTRHDVSILSDISP
ncbi:MAG: GGDEF domain-containing protein [Sphaerochaeta sp.]|nr:GGDEF domain-containing protein [Sphaerochaeta sp.]